MTAARRRQATTALVIHGGAGVIERSALSAEDERAIRADLDRALDAGNAVLAKRRQRARCGRGGDRGAGGFAALQRRQGRGVQRRGRPRTRRLDHGRPHPRAGAVAGVTTVRNPITLARAVMEHSDARDARRRRRGAVRRHAAGDRARARTTGSTPTRAASSSRRRRRARRRDVGGDAADAGQLLRHGRRGRARCARPHRRGAPRPAA